MGQGWYIGPATEYYSCKQVYVNTTIVERVGDTVEFFPHHTNIPFVPSDICISLAAA